LFEKLTKSAKKKKDIFVNFEDPEMEESLRREPNGPLAVFFTALALCHTIVPDKDEQGALEYQASSPDEMALVCAARQLGYFFCGRRGRSVVVKV
jgi:magnesium-transporting ATPase (P-type)